MRNEPATAMVAAMASGVLLLAIAYRPIEAASATTTATHGVNVWVLDQPFQGDPAFLKARRPPAVALDKAPCMLRGCPVMAGGHLLVAFDEKQGHVRIYTRQGGRVAHWGTTMARPSSRPVTFRLLPGGDKRGPGIEVRTAKGDPQYTVCLDERGIIELCPGQITGLTIGEGRMRYGIVPSLIGVDLVFDPRDYPKRDELHVPSMNMLVGLMEGEDGMMVAVWPPGGQATRLGLTSAGAGRCIDAVSVDLDGRSLYLTYVARPGLWHAEPLKDGYLEKDTVIAWRRPFEAKWIGRFLIESEGINYPFYFARTKEKLWGRYIKSWYHYPVWFDKDRTVIHFEKRFPPTGEMLIYYLEALSGNGGDGNAPLSPVAVMRQALGAELTAKLLDFEGINDRPLLKHHRAVCAMTKSLTPIFESGQEVTKARQVVQTADDVARFIRLIRERVMEYDAFAEEMKDFLARQGKADAKLASAFRRAGDGATAIRFAVANGMPSESLEEVRSWTDEIKAMTSKVAPGNAKRYSVLAGKCRSVAGTQDDLARTTSILAIRMMEAAAAAGVASPRHVRLAEQIIARTRQVLRRPSWWEPRRVHVPRRDPGNE